MESTADGSFMVEDSQKEDSGTEVILHLKEEEKKYLDECRSEASSKNIRTISNIPL
jgi:HSP90 family molecular chaperone